MFKPYNVAKLKDDWQLNKRWQGIKRPYNAEDVVRLRGSVQVEHTLARIGAERLWRLLAQEDYVHALGAVTGNHPSKPHHPVTARRSGPKTPGPQDPKTFLLTPPCSSPAPRR